MKTDEEILYEIYHSYELKRYEQIKVAFDKKDFDYLRSNGHPYVKVTRKEKYLKSSALQDVIKELEEIKETAQDHEAFMTVDAEIDDNEQPIICVNSIVYDLHPITTCELNAKSTVHHYIWKLKHHPDGNVAKIVRAKIEKYKGN